MKDYSFLNSLLLVNGVEISGFGEGDDAITMERNNDSASHKVGADGEMTVSISADRTGRLAFNLMQTSDSNTYLSALINAQENDAFVPIFVQYKDTRGKDIVSATQGYLTRPATMTRGANANEQEWVIVTERLDMLHLGGVL